jgi:thymidylate synthase
MFDVRRIDGTIYLDATLTQRSNDMLVAHHINAMQYVALQMMIATHFGWEVGKFFYFVNNLHIYDNQFEQAETLLSRAEAEIEPKLALNLPKGTNFYKIKAEDFELLDYHPVKPQLKFDLAI